jgi:polygalacturonase
LAIIPGQGGDRFDRISILHGNTMSEPTENSPHSRSRQLERPIKRLRRAAANLGCLFVVLSACLISFGAPAQSASTAKLCAEPPASSLVVDVKAKGAKGDGHTDDTVAIQAAIDAVGGTQGTVLVPDGTYLINAVHRETLKLKSDMTLRLAKGAVLKAIPNDEKRYAILHISGVSNISVVGGTLLGERDKHIGEEGQGGMGIRIDNGAAHISISGVTATAMWGDGFYIDDAHDVTLCGVTADGNRRQGLSIIEADGVLVKNSVFQNTAGTPPSAGIDLEPDERAQAITNVRIQSSRFLDNAGPGLEINGKKGPVSDIEITHNIFRARRPILVRDAHAGSTSSICSNRYIKYLSEPNGLYAFADPAELAASQDELATFNRGGNGTAPCDTRQ